jgi:predicted SprT family Zn-dependent metalloprotease
VTRAGAIPARTDPVWRSVRRTLARLGDVWDWPELPWEVTVVFSRRLTRHLGRATVSTGRVVLHIALAGATRPLLREVLCHEAAHIVVFRRYGEGMRPHGPEWAKLVWQAGYQPSRSLAVTASEIPSRPTNTRRYEHLCPLCQSVRIAKRPMARWRCQACVDAGLPGTLQIQRLGP